MCGTCSGGGGGRPAAPPSTSRPYTPSKPIVHRQSMSSSGGSPRASSFGTPKIKFSSRGR